MIFFDQFKSILGMLYFGLSESRLYLQSGQRNEVQCQKISTLTGNILA